ncbi:uncharacterized protein KIAA1614 homolog isoform X2 [Heliangelus exortis]|uniref:uncharacterized protein KIAA1614 homolog isoform X2 n=1 Tax=Heliangelus exortis TaxID=472823 RepID=UPI003A8FD199
MEGGYPAETGRAPWPPKHPGQAPTPSENPEATPSPHAVLESKVKALKERRGAGRPGASAATPERSSPRKPRTRRGKPGWDAAAPEPRAQLRTYLTDGLLDGGDPAPGPPLTPPPRAGTPGLWRVPASRGDEGSGSRGSAFPQERSPAGKEVRDWGAPSASPAVSGGWERLSLAERVERNRRLLQEVLGLAVPEVPVNDGDWDSGVPLQNAEGCRAFVPGQELELSPRHEHAKQLLQRARMKARTNPLRASHDILLLPTTAPRPREPSGRPSLTPRDGGSLSDSSSGDSSCGRPRRPRGPSPSRVRFEDESARDAEVRYLERLQLRHRRVLGSALPSPGPAGGEQPGDGAGQPEGQSGNLVAGGKCSACGSFLGAAATTRGTDRPAATDAAESSPVARGRTPGDSVGLSPARLEPKTRALGPRGSPLWILPSRQRIHTEKIKETYIGDVTYIDEVDSALESTDTSDGCRTDSEEPGPRSPHPRGHRDPRARGHRTPRATPQPEARAGKGTCVASGGPDTGVRGSGAAASQAGTVCPPPPGRTGSREDADPQQHPGGKEGVGNAAHPLQKPSEPPEQLGASTPLLGTHLPTPPPTKKACSQVPFRKPLFTGVKRASSQGSRVPEPDDGSPAPPQPGATAGPGERRGPCSPRWLPGSPLRALSTNNCNNTRGQDGQDTPGMGRVTGTLSQPVVPVPQEAAGPPVEDAGAPGAQQPQHSAKSTAQGEPERPQSHKGSSSSALGLRKLLSSLSQSTKQRLGRFRCYSMEQLPAPSSTPPDGPTMKKSPSLQSLQLPGAFP